MDQSGPPLPGELSGPVELFEQAGRTVVRASRQEISHSPRHPCRWQCSKHPGASINFSPRPWAHSRWTYFAEHRFPCRKSRSPSPGHLMGRLCHTARRGSPGEAVRFSLGLLAVIVSGCRRRSASVSGGSITSWCPSPVFLHGGGQMTLIRNPARIADVELMSSQSRQRFGRDGDQGIFPGRGPGKIAVHAGGIDDETPDRRIVLLELVAAERGPQLAYGRKHECLRSVPWPGMPASLARERNRSRFLARWPFADRHFQE